MFQCFSVSVFQCFSASVIKCLSGVPVCYHQRITRFHPAFPAFDVLNALDALDAFAIRFAHDPLIYAL